MAKDGTQRGGRRPGSGRMKKSTEQKILEGVEKPKLLSKKPIIEDFQRDIERDILDSNSDFSTNRDSIYTALKDYLVTMGCAGEVFDDLISQYAIQKARWLECENHISKEGLIGQHPTTGADIASPYVTMSRDYSKQVSVTWYAILATVKESATGASESEDKMEQILMAGRA